MERLKDPRYLALVAICFAAGVLFGWSITATPEAWLPGCLASPIILGVALVLLWSNEEADQ